MNIIEATKAAMEQGCGIIKKDLKKAGYYLLPTNTSECYLFIPIGYSHKENKEEDKKVAARWNPHAADILSDEWELTEADFKSKGEIRMDNAYKNEVEKNIIAFIENPNNYLVNELMEILSATHDVKLRLQCLEILSRIQ